MEQAASQLLRALRGKRSQVAFSRRLGYRGNVAAKWEGGHRYPTFGEMFRAAGRVGIDVSAALVRFHAASADRWQASDPEDIAAWMAALRGSTTQAALAERSGLSRQQVGRMLSGRSRGRLPEVMMLLDAMTGRLPDLVGELVPIEQVAALAKEAEVRSALAGLAISHPWSPAAQAWLDAREEIPTAHAATDLAAATGIGLAEAHRLLDALVAAGAAQIRRGPSGRKMLMPGPPTSVEVRATPEDLRAIRAHWASVSAARVARGESGDLFSFNVFAIGRDDLQKVKEAQRRFYREVRSIVAESPPEVAAMLVVHTAAFDPG